MSTLSFGRILSTTPPCTCMIMTRDGAKTIRSAVESAVKSGCFAEILVLLDSRTRDSTKAILLQYAAIGIPIRIIPYKWSDPPDFAAARNYHLLNVRTPYAFWLDDDETIAEPQHLRAMLRKARGQAFCMWVVSPLSNGQNFSMYQPRLFPVRRGIFWECPVFERIDFSLDRQGIPQIKTPYAVIYHAHGYSDDRTLRQKNARNRRILERAARTFTGGYEQTKHLREQYMKLIGA